MVKLFFDCPHSPLDVKTSIGPGSTNISQKRRRNRAGKPLQKGHSKPIPSNQTVSSFSFYPWPKLGSIAGHSVLPKSTLMRCVSMASAFLEPITPLHSVRFTPISPIEAKAGTPIGWLSKSCNPRNQSDARLTP